MLPAGHWGLEPQVNSRSSSGLGAAPCSVPRAATEGGATAASSILRAGRSSEAAPFHNEIPSSCRSVGRGSGGDKGGRCISPSGWALCLSPTLPARLQNCSQIEMLICSKICGSLMIISDKGWDELSTSVSFVVCAKL